MKTLSSPAACSATLLLFCLLPAARAQGTGAPFAHLPEGWKVVRSFEAPPDRREAVGRKLGGRLARLSNTVLDVKGGRLQVNILEGATEEDADALFRTLSRMKGNPDLCLRRGKRVVEFVCRDLRLARRARYVLGFTPARAAFRVRFDAAPVEHGDYMVLNPLFNALLDLEKRPGDGKAEERVRALSEKLTFGRTLRLRAAPSGGKPPAYTFTPEPVSSRKTPSGAVSAFAFAGLPERAGIPCVHVEARIEVKAFAAVPAPDPGKALLAGTPFWPVRDPEVTARVKEITARAAGPEEKLRALLDWMMPGRNLRYGGRTGTRCGVKQVLSQGYGRCWDFSDLFVTFCRAAGVPCRQVAGWLHGDTGHVWAEAYLRGRGWVQVDPTAGMECGTEYVPIFTTEDGEMPVLYLSLPEVELVD